MSSSDRSSLAKRLIKDLVIPKPDELGNCAATGPNGNRSGGGGCGGAILGATAGSQLLPSDGYVIVSFSNRKKAQIQTAMFSDVSKNSTDAINLLKAQNNGGSVGSQGGRGEDQQMPDEDSFYGEAFWIGSEDEDEPGPMSGVESGSAEMRALAGGGESLDAANDSSQDENEHEPPVVTVAGAGAASCDSGSDLAGSNSAATGGNTTSRPHNKNNSQKMSRLTALSRGLLTSTENLNGAALGRGNKLLSARHKSYFGDSRAVYYGGGEDGRKMLRCRECGKHYRNDYSLRHHICLRRKEVWKKGDVPKELVDGQLIYFCPTCSKPFRWMGNLTRHFYVHTGQRFFKCDICDKEFFSAYQVRRHMNSHTGMRYKCRVCDKPFTCVYACTWHMRQHAPHSHSNPPGLPPGAAALSATCVATAAHSSSSSSSDTIASKMIISVPSSSNTNTNVTNINSNYNNNDNNININNNNNTLNINNNNTININNNNTININNNNNTININNNNTNNKHKSDQVEKIAI